MRKTPQALLCSSILAAFLAPVLGLPAAENEPQKYIGPGSCAATSCHGSVRPVAGSRILQNEYSTWIIQDKHSRAYQALTGDVGERMAKILRLGKAEESPKCLACHALAPPPELVGRKFEVTEGVTCENCHGPAQGWLGQHTAKDSPEKHLQSVHDFHMVDTRNVIVRTEKCLECHLGNSGKFVDHEMIAAGRPDLYFELDSFSAVMPRHWNIPRLAASGAPAEDASWKGVRDWSTGQAVQLRAAMDRVDVGPPLRQLRPASVARAEIVGDIVDPAANALIKRMSGRNIPSFPASPAITRSPRRKTVGVRSMATPAAVPAIPRGTNRVMLCSVCWPRKWTPRARKTLSKNWAPWPVK